MVEASLINLFSGVIGALIVGILLLAFIIYKVRSNVDDTGTNEDSGSERLEQSASRKESLGLRKKVGFLPLPAKVALLLTLAASARLSYEAYVFFKTGSPTQFLTSQLAENSTIFLVATLVGLAFERRRSRRDGLLSARVEKQPDDGGEIETRDVEFQFNPTDTDSCNEGTIVYPYTRHRVLGLYRRPKSIIEDRRTRENPQPPGDKIGILLPEEEVSDHERYIHVRTGSIEVVEDPEKPYDMKFASPPRLSPKKREQLKTDKNVLRQERDQAKIRLAAAHKTIMTLREAEQEAFERRIDDVQKLLSKIGDHIGPTRATFQRHQHGQSHSQRSEAKDNGHDDELTIESIEELQEKLN